MQGLCARARYTRSLRRRSVMRVHVSAGMEPVPSPAKVVGRSCIVLTTFATPTRRKRRLGCRLQTVGFRHGGPQFDQLHLQEFQALSFPGDFVPKQKALLGVRPLQYLSLPQKIEEILSNMLHKVWQWHCLVVGRENRRLREDSSNKY